MKIKTSVLTGTSKLSKITDLSREASNRVKWFDYYRNHGNNARLTCRYFGISPQTFYRWKKRYNTGNLKSLEAKSCRPKRVRQPRYSSEQIKAVQRLREKYPRWGKGKLAVLLAEEGHQVSVSTVGRIIGRLKERGILREPIPNYVSARKRQRKRPYAIRKPKEYAAEQMGDLIQLDTLDIRPLPGVSLKHLTAHDATSKWNVLGIYSRATARTAAHFLNILEIRMPFNVKAIQVDGGSEFEAVFEEECQKRGIKLFVLPPRSPKLNGGVERAHRTHTEEFYEITDSTFELIELRKELLQWEIVYNSVRPHQALGYLTPLKYVQQNSEGGKVSLTY